MKCDQLHVLFISSPRTYILLSSSYQFNLCCNVPWCYPHQFSCQVKLHQCPLRSTHLYPYYVCIINTKPLTNINSTTTTYETETYMCVQLTAGKYIFLHYMWLLNGVGEAIPTLKRNRILWKDRWFLFIYSWLVSSGQVDGWLHSLVGYANGLYIIDFYVDRMGK